MLRPWEAQQPLFAQQLGSVGYDSKAHLSRTVSRHFNRLA